MPINTGVIARLEAQSPFVRQWIHLFHAVGSELEQKRNRQMRRVLELRYGLDGHTVKTLEEVAVIMRITRERVRQIEAKAFRIMRHHGGSR